jgi:hypothetical protein
VTTLLALAVALAALGVFFHSMSIVAGEIVYGEADGDGPAPGSEKFPLIAGVAILIYLAIGQLIVS